MAVVGNAKALGAVSLLPIYFAMNGVGSVMRILGEHLGGTTRWRQQHTLDVVLGESFHYGTGHRCLTRTGISAQQKHGIVGAMKQEMSELGNKHHLVGVGLVWEAVHHLHTKTPYAFGMHVCVAAIVGCHCLRWDRKKFFCTIIFKTLKYLVGCLPQ